MWMRMRAECEGRGEVKELEMGNRRATTVAETVNHNPLFVPLFLSAGDCQEQYFTNLFFTKEKDLNRWFELSRYLF
jgi:hypothetical protein